MKNNILISVPRGELGGESSSTRYKLTAGVSQLYTASRSLVQQKHREQRITLICMENTETNYTLLRLA